MAEYICPHCGNPIYDDDALLCHFCGESLQRSCGGFLGKMKYARARYVWVLLILAVLAGFMTWVFF